MSKSICLFVFIRKNEGMEGTQSGDRFEVIDLLSSMWE